VPKPWTNSGLDLHLERNGTRVRAGLETALRDAVRAGRLAPGTRLPASRTLASDLGIARNTVTEAYSQLIAEGWLVARQGSGTRVAEILPVARAAAATPSRTSQGAIAERPPLYDLTPGRPELAAFPRSAWLTAARRALAAAPAHTLGYTDPRGLPELRTAVAEYLARARGVSADPDRVVICAGFTQGWGLICGVLHNRGVRSIAMETHGVADHRRIARSHRLRIRDLAVDPGGAVIEPDDAGAILLTPAHQFPLGMALAPPRRAQAVAWAKERGGLVIEDDYDGEFRYDRHPVGAMQALAPEHVVYAGTASKSLAPGLRLGWLVLPAELVDSVAEAQALALGGVSAIDQLTLAQLIASGSYDRHLRRARLTQRRRRDRLLAMVARHSTHVRVTGIAAGLHALVTLPTGVSETAVIDAAARRGLALNGLARFTTGKPPDPGALIIGYGTPPEHSYTAALARLDATLTETLSPSQPAARSAPARPSSAASRTYR